MRCLEIDLEVVVAWQRGGTFVVDVGLEENRIGHFLALANPQSNFHTII